MTWMYRRWEIPNSLISSCSIPHPQFRVKFSLRESDSRLMKERAVCSATTGDR